MAERPEAEAAALLRRVVAGVERGELTVTSAQSVALSETLRVNATDPVDYDSDHIYT